MIWKAGKFNIHSANLGNGLTLIVQWSHDADSIRKDLPWQVIVFGKMLRNCRELEEAKDLAESTADKFLDEAKTKLHAVGVLEGKQ